MKIILFFLFILPINLFSQSQNDSVLKEIIEKYASIETFKCNIDYNSSKNSKFIKKGTLILSKNQNNNVFGYDILLHGNIQHDDSLLIFFTDNSFYLRNDVLSIKEKNVNYFDYKKALFSKEPILIDMEKISIFQLLLLLKSAPKYETISVERKENDIINSKFSYHYQISHKNLGYDLDLYFDTTTLIPVQIKIACNDLVDDKPLNSTVIFQGCEINSFSGSDYLSERQVFYSGIVFNDIVGMDAPQWEYPYVDSNSYLSLNSLKGKNVVMDVTGTFWCYACRRAAKALEIMKQDSVIHSDIEYVTIFPPLNKCDSIPTIKKFIEFYNIKGHNLIGTGDVFTEYRYRRKGVPKVFIIDKSGKVVYQHHGAFTDMENIIPMELRNLE